MNLNCFKKRFCKKCLDLGLYESARKLYQSLGNFYCKALDQEIKFDNCGWKHLFLKKNDDGKPRNIDDIHRRLKSIFVVKIVLNSLDYFQDKYNVCRILDKDGNQKLKIKYWIFLIYYKKVRYLIILRKINRGAIHFYSIIPNWSGCIPRKNKNSQRKS